MVIVLHHFHGCADTTMATLASPGGSSTGSSAGQVPVGIAIQVQFLLIPLVVVFRSVLFLGRAPTKIIALFP
jgi:hypothetical protein